MRGGVHIWGFVGFVSRVLFPWVMWSMLSGPRHLLLAPALGMCVGPVVVYPPVLSFFCLLAAFCVLAVSFVCLFCPLILVFFFLRHD